jgi:hypothetical protein
MIKEFKVNQFYWATWRGGVGPSPEEIFQIIEFVYMKGCQDSVLIKMIYQSPMMERASDGLWHRHYGKPFIQLPLYYLMKADIQEISKAETEIYSVLF